MGGYREGTRYFIEVGCLRLTARMGICFSGLMGLNILIIEARLGGLAVAISV